MIGTRAASQTVTYEISCEREGRGKGGGGGAGCLVPRSALCKCLVLLFHVLLGSTLLTIFYGYLVRIYDQLNLFRAPKPLTILLPSTLFPEMEFQFVRALTHLESQTPV